MILDIIYDILFLNKYGKPVTCTMPDSYNELSLMLNIMIAAAVAGLGIFGLRHLLVNVVNPAGNGAYKKTRRILRSYALIRGFKVLTNIKVPAKNKTCEIENILMGASNGSGR